ncbi:MAG: ParB N-terminal domain-containing protein [Planctomycetota bacterium]
MQIDTWPIERVRPYEGNPRTITPAAIDKVAESLSTFGWRQPLVVDEHGVLIVGHTRLAAAKQLGMPEVPVHVAEGLDEAQVRAYRLADNRTGEEAGWNEEALAAELRALGDVDLAALTAFDSSELDRYLTELAGDAPPAGDDGDLGATENGFEYQERYGVIVECDTEDHQKRVFDVLTAAGHQCRVVSV